MWWRTSTITEYHNDQATQNRTFFRIISDQFPYKLTAGKRMLTIGAQLRTAHLLWLCDVKN